MAGEEATDMDPVVLTIKIEHDEPLEAEAVALLLESVSALHLLFVEGESNLYFDSEGERWRIRPSEDGLLPSTPMILETDAAFVITLATVAAVAAIVGAVAAVVQTGIMLGDRRERRRRRKQAAQEASAKALEGTAPDGKVREMGTQVGGDIIVNGDGNMITVTQQAA